MARFSVLAAFLSAVLYFSPSLALSVGQDYMGPAVPFIFRDAVLQDLDEFVTVFYDAFSAAPSWGYFHQFEDQYPGYARYCMREQLRPMLENTDKIYTLKVIAVPDKTARSGERVVSLSVWAFNYTSSTLGQQASPSSPDTLMTMASLAYNCSARSDTNRTRAEPWEKATRDALQKYLLDAYDHQSALILLATHPTWDGNGFAATHLRWGISVADHDGVPTTLLGTPAGHPLYKSFGFRDIFNVTVERLDGKGTIWMEVMEHPAGKLDP